MQFAKQLLLTAAAIAAAGVRRGLAQSEIFDSVPAIAGCSARTVSVAAPGVIQCAVRSLQNQTSSSFSFINGVCVLSDNRGCAASGAASIFVKRAQHPGYVQQIDARQFWVFQQRLTGRVAFSRTWVEYEQGFGEGIDGADTEFWSGLQQLSTFTRSHNNTLRIEARTMTGSFYVAEWLNCTVDSASTNYVLNCGAFLSGSSNFSGDAMGDHRGRQFSTMDRDNDASPTSCSSSSGAGGFWFASCFRINPNAQFPTAVLSGPAAWPFMCCAYIENYVTLRFTRMMLQI